MFPFHYRIYYEDGSIFDSEFHNHPSEANPFGVIVIAQTDPRKGREVLDGNDFYYMRAGRWYGADLIGLLDQLGHNFDELSAIVFGRMTSRENFERLVQRACDDPELPRMSAK